MILSVGLFAPEAAAQDPCPPTSSAKACFEQLYSKARVRGVDSTAALVAAQLTGFTGFNGEYQRSKTDFATPFGGGLSVPSGVGEDVALGLEFNRASSFGALKVQTLFRRPAPYAPLLDSVEQSQRGEAKAFIDQRLRGIDDLEVSVQLTPFAGGGRHFDPHREWIAALNERVVSVVDSDSLTTSLDRLSGLVTPDSVRENLVASRTPSCQIPDTTHQRWDRSGPEGDSEAMEVPLGCIRPGFRAKVLAALKAAADIAGEYRGTLVNRVSASGLFLIPYLVNNEPQVVLSVGIRPRSDWVGPPTGWLGLRFEGGWPDLSALREYQAGSDDDSCRGEDLTALRPECLSGFMSEATILKARRGHSIAVEVKLLRTSADTIALPTFNAALRPPERLLDLEVNATYGFYTGVDLATTAPARGRVEFTMGLERHWGQYNPRKDRFKLESTYTHRVADNVDFSLGFVLANKSEFLGGPEWPIGTRAGLSYALKKKGGS
ncbi:MAG: hypothetical protein RLN75_01995 [Longimicrobiales bacterium]